MPTTPSRLTSDVCRKCQGRAVPEVVQDYEVGLRCQVLHCMNCGAYQGWGPVRELTWPTT